jgi:hypothetical protein
MRSPLILTLFLLAGLTLSTGCMLPNRGNNDEGSTDETTSNSGSDDDGKDVPGRDDNSDNDGGSASDGDVRTESGTLASGDQQLTSGEYADLYNINVDQGETIIVEMTSSQFDPYLILRPPGGTQVDNDDFEGDRTRSRIEYVATTGGSYDVIATSYAVGESGAYQVTMETGTGIGGGTPTTSEGGGGK